MAKGILARVGAVKFPRETDVTALLAAILEQCFGICRQDLDNRSIVLDATVANVSTAADVLETILASYTLPASNLSATGNYFFRWKAFGNKPNTHTTTFKLYLGSTLIATIVNTTAGAWTLEEMISVLASNYATAHAFTGTLDFTSDLLFKLTATNGTAAAGDCVFYGSSLELLNQPT